MSKMDLFVSAAINKYIYISGHERLSDNFNMVKLLKNMKWYKMLKT